jgi:hypothetical protein
VAGPAAGALVALAPLPARAREIALPVENGHRADSPLPGAALATALCSTCHSAEYVLDPPPISPRTSWPATGTKRQKTFAAPLPDDAVAPIVDSLVELYGVENPPAPPTPAPAQPAKSARPQTGPARLRQNPPRPGPLRCSVSARRARLVPPRRPRVGPRVLRACAADTARRGKTETARDRSIAQPDTAFTSKKIAELRPPPAPPMSSTSFLHERIRRQFQRRLARAHAKLQRCPRHDPADPRVRGSACATSFNQSASA